jgi:hypothetical protein
MGVAAVGNYPGGREGGCTWIDNSGNFWVFGGYGKGASGTTNGVLNDLWKFDGTNWAWMKGSNAVNPSATPGTKGTPASANSPAGRYFSGCSYDSTNNLLWLFGGENNSYAYEDLWKFDGTDWTWMTGSTTVQNPISSGTYGSLGQFDGSYNPGSRSGFGFWLDGNKDVWLFGGSASGYQGTSRRNDLWKFSVSGGQWGWVGGTMNLNDTGVNGTVGTPAAANIPSARFVTAVTTKPDSNNKIWLFGGTSNSQLWSFDTTTGYWTLVHSGTTSFVNKGISGGQPGSESQSRLFVDSSNRVWLLRTTLGNPPSSSLWMFSGGSWTWVAGNATGVEDFAAPAVGGAYNGFIRSGNDFSGVIDSTDHLWIYGGYTSLGRSAELWKITLP